MVKKYLVLSLSCILSLSLVSCSKSNRSSSNETSYKETVNVPPESHNTKIKATFYNYLDGETYGEYLSDEVYEELTQYINGIRLDSNLLRNSTGKNSKSKPLTPIMQITTESETISYLGNNSWSFKSDDEEKIYQSADSKEVSYPCMFLATKLCLPYACAYSHSEAEYNESYLQMRGMDVQEIADSLKIDYAKTNTNTHLKYPDSKVIKEEVCLFKNNTNYLKYLSLKKFGSDGKGAYSLKKSEINGTTGEPVDSSEHLYSYIKYNDVSYYCDNAEDKFYKAKDFKDDFFIKDEHLFFEQLMTSYKYQYNFPVKLYDKTYYVEVFKNNDEFICVLLNDVSHPGKSWSISSDGLKIATDLIYYEESDDKEVEKTFTDEIEEARSKLVKKVKKNSK